MRSTHSARMRVSAMPSQFYFCQQIRRGEIYAKPVGQMTHAFTFTIAPIYFYPAETTGITSFLFLYALHDASVKSMPDNP